jgi:rhodanese-related sulfurtransferase
MYLPSAIANLTPRQVNWALETRQIMLIDVRERAEFASEHIEGALNVPLSTLDPALLPKAANRILVFQCATGARSAAAIELCRAAGCAFDAQLSGGLAAWKQRGLPTIRAQAPATAVTEYV